MSLQASVWSDPEDPEKFLSVTWTSWTAVIDGGNPESFKYGPFTITGLEIFTIFALETCLIIGYRKWKGTHIRTVLFNYLLTYDSYVPLYNRFHRGEWITRVSGGEGALDEASAIWAQECPGPPPPTHPSNPFPPMKSIIHGHIRISGP
jgi:hypothetical protein